MSFQRAASFCAALFFLAVSFSKPAESQTLRVSLQELTESSETVVMGRTTRLESAWNADRSAIMTQVTIRVEEALFGTSAGEQTFIVPGGQVGDLLHEVSDMPVFMENEEVVVFLTQHASGVTIVNGGVQGKLEVLTDPQTGERTVRGAANILEDDTPEKAGSITARSATVDEEAEGVSVPLGQLMSRVKQLVRDK